MEVINPTTLRTAVLIPFPPFPFLSFFVQRSLVVTQKKINKKWEGLPAADLVSRVRTWSSSTALMRCFMADDVRFSKSASMVTVFPPLAPTHHALLPHRPCHTAAPTFFFLFAICEDFAERRF